MASKFDSLIFRGTFKRVRRMCNKMLSNISEMKLRLFGMSKWGCDFFQRVYVKLIKEKRTVFSGGVEFWLPQAASGSGTWVLPGWSPQTCPYLEAGFESQPLAWSSSSALGSSGGLGTGDLPAPQMIAQVDTERILIPGYLGRPLGPRALWPLVSGCHFLPIVRTNLCGFWNTFNNF